MPNQQFNHETMITQVESKLKKTTKHNSQTNIMLKSEYGKKNIFSLKENNEKK
jgi:hypothetical protein